MPPSLDIRPETDADFAAIRQMHESAFPTDAEARLVDQLRAAGNLTLSLVALVDGEVVGHVALSPVTIEGAPVGLGLAPVAVSPERQGTGIGSELIRKALGACRENTVALVVVLGEPAYYARFGFVPASRHGLQDTYGGGDAFQVLLLDSDRVPATGLVQYAPEFALFD
jgi:putative acetyltransferase